MQCINQLEQLLVVSIALRNLHAVRLIPGRQRHDRLQEGSGPSICSHRQPRAISLGPAPGIDAVRFLVRPLPQGRSISTSGRLVSRRLKPRNFSGRNSQRYRPALQLKRQRKRKATGRERVSNPIVMKRFALSVSARHTPHWDKFMRPRLAKTATADGRSVALQSRSDAKWLGSTIPSFSPRGSYNFLYVRNL